ncbi:MAG: protein kinase [Gemmatimonadaceae bacterium]
MNEVPERLAEALAGRYRIERELGAGGMATVYLAEDLKHHRNVAIKVLHAELSAILGPERFLKEIELTANLQHPHILPLFDSGNADGLLYYVMPYVEGETLRDRLTRDKQLPIADAVRIAGEAADALHYAHGRGIVHRDIKPENILLQGGHCLVADFGIALAVEQAGGTRMTQTGLSLGTPQYMSPEQAMGERDIGPRSDIYSLGAVTYEMLSGDPPFSGSTAQAIVAQVITTEPRSLTLQRKSVPPHVDAAVMTALEKLPADRFASASEFSAALAGDGHATITSRYNRPAAIQSHPWRRISALLAALSLALIGLTAWMLTRHGEPNGPQVFDAALPDTAAMTFAATTAKTAYGTALRNISISPTGDFAVYVARQGDSTQLWYRSLRDATAHGIAGTAGATAPRVSPDGSRIAFLDGGRVMVVPVQGGQPRRLLDGQSPMSLEWISRSMVLAIDEDGDRLSWIDPEAGLQRSMKALGRCTFGRPIPEDKQLICPVDGTVSVMEPESGKRWTIRAARSDGSPGGPLTGSAFHVVDGRYLVYLSPDGDLRAARYDAKRYLASKSVTLLNGVRREEIGEGQFDISADGTLAYAPGADATVGRLVRLNSGGTPVPLPVDPAAFQRFDLSRDRRWLAAVVHVTDGQELRIYDLQNRQNFVWLRAELIRHALWSPTGDRLVVGLRDSTRWSVLSGSPGTGVVPDTVYTTTGALRPDPSDFPADNQALATSLNGSATLQFNPMTRRARLDTVASTVGAYFVSLSPDGKHILYENINEQRVVTTSYPLAGQRWQIAADGVEPLWLSSTEVLYRSGVSWYLARLNPVTGEPLGAPTLWARDPRFSDTPGWSNRLSHDGGIIYLQGPEQVSAPYLRVVPNWVAHMEAAVNKANP